MMVPDEVRAKDIDATLCTHYVYAYAILDDSTFTIGSSDPSVDITNGDYLTFTELRAKNTQAKFLLALGGQKDANDFTSKYSNLVSNTANINSLVTSTVAYLKKYNFDGLSFDWLNLKSPDDYSGYSKLIIALKTAFEANNFTLSSAVSGLKERIDGI